MIDAALNASVGGDGLILTESQRQEQMHREREKMLENGRKALRETRTLAEAVYEETCVLGVPELREAAAGVLTPVIEMDELLKGLEGKDIAVVLTEAVLSTMKKSKEIGEKSKRHGKVSLSDIITLRQRALDLGKSLFHLYPLMPKPFTSELDYAMKRVTDLRILLLDQQVHF